MADKYSLLSERLELMIHQHNYWLREAHRLPLICYGDSIGIFINQFKAFSDDNGLDTETLCKYFMEMLFVNKEILLKDMKANSYRIIFLVGSTIVKNYILDIDHYGELLYK